MEWVGEQMIQLAGVDITMQGTSLMRYGIIILNFYMYFFKSKQKSDHSHDSGQQMWNFALDCWQIFLLIKTIERWHT